MLEAVVMVQLKMNTFNFNIQITLHHLLQFRHKMSDNSQNINFMVLQKNQTDRHCQRTIYGVQKKDLCMDLECCIFKTEHFESKQTNSLHSYKCIFTL